MGSLGLLLGVLMAVVCLGSLIWLHVRGFKDGAFADPLLFLTGVSLISYMVTRWDRAKIPTLVLVCGLTLGFLISGPLSGEQRAIEAYNQGVEAMNCEDLDQAITCFAEAIRLNPKFAEAYCNRGIVYDEKGEPDKAIADFTEAIRLNPKFTEAYHNRGVVYTEKGEPDKAIADYTEAIRLNPKFAEAYYNRGAAYTEKGEQATAEADFAKVRELGDEPE